MAIRIARITVIAWLAFLTSQVAFASEIVHLTPDDFHERYLPGCSKQVLWLKAEIKSEIEQILDRPYAGARIRYCATETGTAWILDEIGKTEPITTGVVIDQEAVAAVRVLIFRESRGGEVHRDVFVQQYDNASLDEAGRLDKGIDGITGATMSVDALNRQVRLALLLDRTVQESARDR